MPKYAEFDSKAPGETPVTGWYDTDNFKHLKLPAAADLLELNDAQWSERTQGRWAVSNGTLVPYTAPALVPSAAQSFAVLQTKAKSALAASDRTILRCYENAAPVPPEWVGYRAELRNIVNGTNGEATSLPTRPAFPAGS